ncbi:maleylpyruvate isomerase N-terminal domain-containing protein [Acidithrix sp. C25]|uniref:maleylpyruvate isomerase N-terminal domain-containing protein n=1 Tax=Acidithrix sp. C25 TaxID=1671482 RepID=UPI00191BC16A|nr:maleylpyruvate isomerase N-terminal domain-containing protein [Acidithrix sp. C25]CAG4924932.1 unnamed protein product [Acidithrix sp. C25]
MAIETSELIDELEKYAAQISEQAPSNLDLALAHLGSWRVSDLLEHLSLVLERAINRIGKTEEPKAGESATGTIDHLEQYTETSNRLIATLKTTSDQTPAWNWTGSNQNSAWLKRRTAHEVAVHSLDIALALNLVQDVNKYFNPKFASDGIAEFVNVFLGRLNAKYEGSSEPFSIHIHANDVSDTEWVFLFGTTTIEAKQLHQKCDLALRGTASALYGWLWNRFAYENLELIGDHTLADKWHEIVKI